MFICSGGKRGQSKINKMPMLHQQKLPFLNAEYAGQYEHMLPSMEWFYAHCKAVTYVCAYSALTMLPGSVKNHVWERLQATALMDILFTFIIFTCPHRKRRLSKRITAFHLHIEIPEVVAVPLLVLYQRYCNHINALQLSHPCTKADTNTSAHSHTLTHLL